MCRSTLGSDRPAASVPAMTKREKVIRSLTAIILLGAVAFGLLGYFQTWRAEKESVQLVGTLERAFSEGSDRPSAQAVQINLQLPTESNYPQFPTVPGLHLERFSAPSPGSVAVLFFGETKASSWCFTVTYTDTEDASVSRERCR